MWFNRSNTVYVGHLGSVPLYVHWSAMFMLLIVFMRYDIAMGCYILLALVVGLLLHELGHGLTAKFYGAHNITITMHAMGGLCSSEGRTESHGEQLAIIAAGPLVSFALAYGSLGLSEGIENWAPQLFAGSMGEVLYIALYYFYHINLILGIFNSMPVYPLDGGQFMFHLLHIFGLKFQTIRTVCMVCAFVGIAAFWVWAGVFTPGHFDAYPLVMGVVLLYMMKVYLG